MNGVARLQILFTVLENVYPHEKKGRSKVYATWRLHKSSQLLENLMQAELCCSYTAINLQEHRICMRRKKLNSWLMQQPL